MIRALSFDLDDTLWEIGPTIVRAEQALQRWLERHHPAIPARFSTLELRQLCNVIATEQPALAHDRSRLRQQALRRAAEQVGETSFCERTAFAVFHRARNEVRLFPDVLTTLQHLQTRYPLAALSNGNADLGLIGIDHLFRLTLNPAVTGVAKPDRAMYLALCERLGLSPAEVVHVGDDPELDVAGAARAGLRTVWVNRACQRWPGGAAADAEVRSLSELMVVLAVWEQQDSPPSPKR